MRLHELRIENLRILEQVALRPVAGVNWLVGANGAGKTSVLEALSLLSSGRSFRGGAVEHCIRRGCSSFTVFGAMESRSGALHRLGLQREAKAFVARIDGESVPSLTALFRLCPVVCVEPDAGVLISGPGEGRRRFLDWGLFHVEQAFLLAWRRFNKALRQRNQLLRRRRDSAEERAWRQELAVTGAALHGLRENYLDALRPRVERLCAWLLPDLGLPTVRYRPGWPAEAESLEAALDRGFAVDLRLGYTALGPQRAGWSLAFASLPHRELFSRGQAKLVSMAMLLAQVEGFAAARGEAPVVALDDVLAELDPENQGRLLGFLQGLGAQVFLTSADRGLLERHAPDPSGVFHVEQGSVRQGV